MPEATIEDETITINQTTIVYIAEVLRIDRQADERDIEGTVLLMKEALQNLT
jgi:hypothetical protein